MLSTVIRATQADHAGAADQHDACSCGEGTSQSGAFVTGGQGLTRVQLQNLAEQGGALLLQWRALFDPAGSDHGRGDGMAAAGLLRFREALVNRVTEALLALRRRQVGDARPTTLSQRLRMTNRELTRS